MRNKELISLLEQCNPDDEICVDIYDCKTNNLVDSSYAIGYGTNEHGELVLKVDAEFVKQTT